MITRNEAATLGLTRYATGKPCRAGHTAERYVSSGACIECLGEHRTAYRDRAVDARAARGRGYRQLTVLVHPDDLQTVREMVEALRQAREMQL